MCGITGVLSFNTSLDESYIESMTSLLKHRGPDASGVSNHWNSSCYLGHRRLSIIDLSDASNQPMTSSCGQYTIVFNGEIYNFEALKQNLLREKNVDFQTGSDTEVLLEAFIHWGTDVVQQLNGMFAFAIVDERNQRVYLFRDRIGIKPLYYYWKDGKFAFASELKALLPLTEWFGKFSISEQALSLYFRLGYIPEPLTIYNEVHKFPSGSWACIDTNGISFKRYWNIHEQVQSTVNTDEAIAKSQLQELVLSSVKYRLKSHVPFGVFLSGGIDSSTVAAVAQKISKQPIQTFSIAFTENTYDESTYAKAVAKHIGSNHHEFKVSYKEAQALIHELHHFFDEPFADASAIPTFLVSKLARSKVKMVLTGDGGDEQFMGYGMYTWAKRLHHPIVKATRKIVYVTLKNSGSNRFKRAADLFYHPVNEQLKGHIFSVEQYLFTEKEVKNLMRKRTTIEKEVFANQSLARRLSPTEQQAFFDLTTYLKDDLLVKVDRSSMKASIEARVPLLDHRIVEFSLNLDESLKVKNGSQKYLLKEVLFDYVPSSLFDRPKWGFGLPIRTWLANELKEVLDFYINETTLNEVGGLNTQDILVLKKRYLKGEDYLYNKLWTVMMYVQWYQHHSRYINDSNG